MEAKAAAKKLRAYRERLKANRPPEISPKTLLKRNIAIRDKQKVLQEHGEQHNFPSIPNIQDESIALLDEKKDYQMKLLDDLNEMMWIWFICSFDRKITDQIMRMKAKKYSDYLQYSQFEATNWLEDFKHKHNLINNEKNELEINFDDEMTIFDKPEVTDTEKNHIEESNSSNVETVDFDSDYKSTDETKKDILKRGHRFKNLEVLKKKLLDFCREYRCELKTSKQLLLKQVDKALLPKHPNENLKFFRLTFVCLQENCQVELRFKMTSCGRFLQLIHMYTHHNHTPLNQISSGYMEFLSNLLPKLAPNKTKTSKIADDCLNVLKEQHDCDVHVMYNDNEISCLFLQNSIMKKAFAAFPEYLLFDYYNKVNLSLQAHLLIVEDSDGKNIIVGVLISTQENVKSIEWCINKFKESNPAHTEIRMIHACRNQKLQQVLQAEFSHIPIYISIYHTMKAFNELDFKAQNDPLSPKIQALTRTILKELAFSVSQKIYITNHGRLEAFAPKFVLEYYNKFWHPIRRRWVAYLTLGDEVFNSRIHDCTLEAIFNELFQAIVSSSNLTEDLDRIFFYINKTLEYSNPTSSIPVENPKSVEELYRTYLTGEGFNKISRQITRAPMCKLLRRNETSGTFLSLTGPLTTTLKECQCDYWKMFGLPCCHMFMFRHTTMYPFYDEDVCSKRWMKTYYDLHKIKPIAGSTTKPVEEEELSMEEIAAERKRKFNLMADECCKIAKLCSTFPKNLFESRLQFMKYLYTKWSNDHKDDKECQSVNSDNEELSFDTLNVDDVF